MKTRLMVAMTALMLTVVGVPGAGAVDGEIANETINFNIGCQQGADGTTCESTQYWLGTNVGDNNVGSTGSFTPINYVDHASSGTYTTTAFAADSSLAESYELVGGSIIAGQIVLSGFISGGEIGVDSGVFVELKARRADLVKFTAVNLGSAEITKVVSTPTDTTYEFSFEVPLALDGVPIRGLNADVGQRHITVLQNGFMDGTGGSFFSLPYFVPETP